MACLWAGLRVSGDLRIDIAMAHRQIIQYAKKQGLRSITIAEDDTRFTASGACDFYVKQKPDDYDLYLGGILYGNLQQSNTVEDFAGTFL